MPLRFTYINPFVPWRMTTAERDAEVNWPDWVVIFNITTSTIQQYDGDIWRDVVTIFGTPSAGNYMAWNATEEYWEPVDSAHGTSQHTEFANWKLIYTDGSGDQQEIALGADGTVLTGTGTGAAPAFEAASEHAHANDHAAVTVSGSPDYITLTGQDIVRGLIVLTTDVSGILPEANLPNASETAEGVVEEATAAEAVTGTADRVMALGVAAAQIQKGSWLYGTDAGGDDAYTVLFTPTIAALTTGMVVCFEPSFTNVGAATLQIEGLVAKTIKKHHDQDLANGDIEAGQIVTVVYDGTVFQMQSQLGNAPSGGGGGQDLVSDTLWAADGDLVVGTGNNAAEILSVGTGVLEAASSTHTYTQTPILAGITETTETNTMTFGDGEASAIIKLTPNTTGGYTALDFATNITVDAAGQAATGISAIMSHLPDQSRVMGPLSGLSFTGQAVNNKASATCTWTFVTGAQITASALNTLSTATTTVTNLATYIASMSYSEFAGSLTVTTGHMMKIGIPAVTGTPSIATHYGIEVQAQGNVNMTTCFGIRITTVVGAVNDLSLYIGSGTPTGDYGIFVDNELARFDGDGSHVFELPANAIDPTGSVYGRVAVQITGVGTKYLVVYN